MAPPSGPHDNHHLQPKAIASPTAQAEEATPRTRSSRTPGVGRVAFWVFLPAALGLIALAVVSWRTGISIEILVRESKADAEHPFVGLLWDTGVLLWTSTSAICLFTAIALRKWQGASRDAGLFMSAGLFTAVLLIDDFFLIHESLNSSRYLLLAYLVVVGALFVGFRDPILSYEYELLLIALSFFGLSLLVDVLQSPVEQRIGDWRNSDRGWVQIPWDRGLVRLLHKGRTHRSHESISEAW